MIGEGYNFSVMTKFSVFVGYVIGINGVDLYLGLLYERSVSKIY